MSEFTFCCKPFETIVKNRFLNWFSYSDDNGKRILVMPYIMVGGIQWRVNHCPSCGLNVRSIEIPEESLIFNTEE